MARIANEVRDAILAKIGTVKRPKKTPKVVEVGVKVKKEKKHE